MSKQVRIEKTCPILQKRGIQVGNEYPVINEGPSDQRKGMHTYLIQGLVDTPIVVYSDEVTVIPE